MPMQAATWRRYRCFTGGIHIYIYVYNSLSLSIYIYTYTHIHTNTREREKLVESRPNPFAYENDIATAVASRMESLANK